MHHVDVDRGFTAAGREELLFPVFAVFFCISDGDRKDIPNSKVISINANRVGGRAGLTLRQTRKSA